MPSSPNTADISISCALVWVRVCACACMYVCEHHLLYIRRQTQITKHVTGRGGRGKEKMKYFREANTTKKPSRKARTGSRANSLSRLLLSFWHGTGQGGEEKELHVLGAAVQIVNPKAHIHTQSSLPSSRTELCRAAGFLQIGSATKL